MDELFSMDLHNYNENGKVFSRPSARAIIERDGKLLLVHATKYNFYKFPGGGIEEGETPEEALIREVAEEVGYTVKKDSIKEFGHVLRRQKDSYDENCIFEQDNLYYTCDVEDTPVETNLDGYEEEYGFTPVWIEPFKASHANRYSNLPDNQEMLKRDIKVLELYDAKLRYTLRDRHMAKTFESLGNPKYAEMLEFVRRELDVPLYEQTGAKTDIFYSRFDHTKRVLSWALKLYRLSPHKELLDFDAIIISTIFHDVGRVASERDKIPHAKAGIPITEKYLLDNGYDHARSEYIAGLVGAHSDKWRMNEPDLDKNLLLLMEADLLDDMGALGIVMDCMITEIRNSNARFEDCYDHIMKYTYRIQHENPMTTEEGKKLWDDKTKLVEAFTDALKGDIEL